jgi:cyclophilin family peptidyl-prolyl cis-trans isomerase
LPTESELMDLANGKFLKFVTTRGDFTLKLSAESPLTSVAFQRLAQQGFFDGLDFHRVVPNFVVQGGDPRGDGSGGPSFLVRDEVSLLRHEPGSVGMATSGKDTGGSQFFANELLNVHLHGSYTVFGSVVEGLETVTQTLEGDQIVSTSVFAK